MPLFYSSSQELLQSQIFERMGHPGKFSGVIVTEDTGQTDFTASNYGYGAIMISGSWNGTIELSGGGQISKAGDAGLAAGTIYELSVSKVHSGAAATGGVYAFKRSS